ncbi:TniQ family protein [Rhizobium leguminosarum]|uniref:TniQ family protein n=1 Tax=Rhizobium leguminosarum TaxID=384 RepID=UPI0024A80401|nr:TniQ family protein [Rhizobium leguminosarum]MDI5929086.1 TniQ family protein [Rhizobium leguminosarum]
MAYPCIKPVEPLTQFISRVAASRGVSLFHYRRHMDIRARYSRREKLYERFSGMSGISEEVLRRHDLVKVGGNVQIFDMTFDLRDVWAKSARVCASCLREDRLNESGRHEARPHQRFSWMLRVLGRCHKHGSGLVQIGSDYDRFSYGDFSRAVVSGSGTLDALLRDEGDNSCIQASDVYFHQRIEDAATLSQDAARVPGGAGPSGDMLEDLPLPAALLLTEIVGGMKLLGDRYRRRRLGEEVRQAAVVAGFEVTSRGYDGLRDFLKEQDAVHWTNARRGHFKNLYGPLQEFLRTRLEEDDYRDVVSFIAEHAMSAHPLGPEDGFLGSALPRRYHSIRTAEVRHHIHRTTLRGILSTAGVLPPGSDAKADGRVLIDANRLEELVTQWRDRLPTEKAKSALRISGPALRSITHKGLLLKTSTNSETDNKISAASYARLMELLDELPRGSPAPRMKRLSYVARMVGRSYAEIVSLVLDGIVANAVIDAGQTEAFRLDQIFLDAYEVKRAFGTADPPGVTFERAERMLGTTTQTVRRIVEVGLIETFETENPVNRRKQRYFSPEAIDQFKKDYVTLRNFALGRGNIARVKAALTALGITPVLKEKGVATIYKASEIPSDLAVK